MHSSASMTLTEAVPSTIENSLWPSSTRTSQVVAHKRVDLEAATQKISSRDLEPSLLQEELEASLVSESNLELWTTTTQDHSISTSSPRP